MRCYVNAIALYSYRPTTRRHQRTLSANTDRQNFIYRLLSKLSFNLIFNSGFLLLCTYVSFIISYSELYLLRFVSGWRYVLLRYASEAVGRLATQSCSDVVNAELTRGQGRGRSRTPSLQQICRAETCHSSSRVY